MVSRLTRKKVQGLLSPFSFPRIIETDRLFDSDPLNSTKRREFVTLLVSLTSP
jgi:hypothetical protein